MRANKKVKTIIASILILGTITTGVSFATTDMGSKLESWYKVMFQQATEEIRQIVDGLSDYLEQQFGPFKKEVISGANKEINETYVRTYSESITNIWVHKGKYIGQINGAKVTINDNITDDFDQYVSELNNEVEAKINLRAIEFLERLNEDLDQEIENMSNDINTISENAEISLSNSINSTKDFINDEIKSKRDYAEDESKENLNERIEKAKESIEKNADLVSEGIIININDKSLEIENQAKFQLDDILKNINK